MTLLADQLPPDIASQLHPDRRMNEQSYWKVRDQLLQQYQGQWIGFANGQVVASGKTPVVVLQSAESTGQHPFVVCVGKETAAIRIRKLIAQYDSPYVGEALPAIAVEFRMKSGQMGSTFSRVIPDTGADASVLAWSDCQQLQLSPSAGFNVMFSGLQAVRQHHLPSWFGS